MSLPKPPATPAAPPPPSPQRRWSSQQLFGGAGTVIEIEHLQQVYQLRQTAQGKLILTK